MCCNFIGSVKIKMLKKKTDYQKAAGKLISAIQKDWGEELGEPSVEFSGDVMDAAHDLLQAGTVEKAKELLGPMTVRQYLGDVWVQAHSSVKPAISVVEDLLTLENISQSLGLELKRLTNFELYDVRFVSGNTGLELVFGYGGSEESETIIRLKGMLHFVFSRAPESEGGMYVGEVTSSVLNDGGKEVFRQLGYCFREESGETASYPSALLHHLHLEGEVCLDAVCEIIEVERRREN